MTAYPNCTCGHSLNDHRDHWDPMVNDEPCRKCSCRDYKRPILPGEPRVEQPKESDPEWLIETRYIDLHVDGDAECDHSFRAWECLGGAYTDGDRKVIVGWMKFESTCRKCPARVGRRIENDVKDDGR